jgi:hypothetical protein
VLEGSTTMLIGYWILAGALALSNLFAAGLKFARTKEQLASGGQAWVEDFSPGAIKGIGVAELLGAIGLILPPLTHIAPVLGPIAAIGVAVLQVGAGITHVRRGEYRMLSANVPLVVLAVVVAVLGFMLFV